MTEADNAGPGMACTPEAWIENYMPGDDAGAGKIERASAARKCTIVVGPPMARPNYPADWLIENGVRGLYRGEPLTATEPPQAA